MSICTLYAFQIYRYDTPIVTINVGNAWTINGNFKFVHIINLDEYATITENVTKKIEKHIHPGQTKQIIDYHLAQIQERLFELKSVERRPRRSIDWIGSAWKWIAGSPDASDWNSILKSQNAIISNNNDQYKINAQLLKTTNEVVRKTNEIILRMNEISSGKEAERIEQGTLNQILILKDAINEIVRACQLAKSGTINTNLLDRTEVESIVKEMETLPYANAIEAMEYGTPSIYANESTLLYVLSIPKLKRDPYHRLIVRPTIRNGKQIDLPFNEVLVSQNETFGVKAPCLNINKVTVCRQSSLDHLGEETCVPRLLKGGSANCSYRKTKIQIVEMITANAVFLTNFKGVVKSLQNSETLNGTYLIQLFNESVMINNETFLSTSISKIQPLPPVLTSLTNERLLVDIDQVHNITLHNIDSIKYLAMKSNLSIGGHIGIVGLISICFGVLWYKITRRLNLPMVKTPRSSIRICGTQIFKEGGVNNSSDTATQQSQHN